MLTMGSMLTMERLLSMWGLAMALLTIAVIAAVASRQSWLIATNGGLPLVAFAQGGIVGWLGKLRSGPQVVSGCSDQAGGPAMSAEAAELLAALKRLVDAAEEWATSDVDMPRYQDAEAEFDAALRAAHATITKSEESQP